MTAARMGGVPRRLSQLSPRKFALACVVAGALGGLAQEPYGIPLAALVAMVLGMMLLAATRSARHAALTGWLFGTGYFLITMTWIIEPFFVDAARHAWMAPFALVFMAAGLALFWGAAFGMARALNAPWAIILTWPMAELARAYVFTGFPWAMIPQAFVDVLAGQALAWVGPHGVMAAVTLAAWLIATPMARGPFVQLGFAAFSIALLTLPPLAAPAPMTDKTVRLVQPNAAQHEKWDPDKVPVFVGRLLEATAAQGPVDLVIWPETALPYLAHQAGPVFEAASERASGAPVVLGIQRYDADRYFNSLVVIGADGAVSDTYDKHHLVPFGEYLPLSGLMRRVGLRGLAENFGGAYAAGPGPRLLDLGALGSALPLICYEAVFAQDVFRAPQRPAFLMQLTNDAWFGAGKGPKQHLAQARMRAIEQGLPMARAANTGISAMIDPKGRVLQALPLGEHGYVDAPLPKPQKPTVYSRTGDAPVAAMLLLALIATYGRKRIRRNTSAR